jgi:hypothetical protein
MRFGAKYLSTFIASGKAIGGGLVRAGKGTVAWMGALYHGVKGNSSVIGEALTNYVTPAFKSAGRGIIHAGAAVARGTAHAGVAVAKRAVRAGAAVASRHRSD